VVGVGDVELDDRETVGVFGYEVVQCRNRADAGDDAVPGGQSGRSDVATESARGAGDEEDV